MRRYETIFILRPDLGESQIKQSLKRVEDIVSNGGGELIETDEWGVRELAYRIRRERRGYYVRLDYVAGGAVMNEVERNLKLMDESLRHLSVMVEDDADPAKLRGEVEARQRRLAEARAAAAAPEPRPAGEQQSEGEAEVAEEAKATLETPAEPHADASAEEPPAEPTETGDGANQN
ncbi:MAG TPA: 30S ribosomal protein S6 [Candidatus Binataceae bacterium]|nr:30S ribosomal protein S6 [Candidatus Binataceae bacterium]